jgi:hypothetical protein
MVSLKQMIDILQLDEHYGISKEVDIAKGYYKKPKGFKESYKFTKRRIKSLRNG